MRCQSRIGRLAALGPFAALFLLVVLVAAPARATVADSSAAGFTVKISVTIAAPADVVFLAVIDDIGEWWDPAHTYSGLSENLTIEPFAGGCFCEQTEGNGSVKHMEVVYVDQGNLLRMAGALGPLQGLGVCGSMTWEFADAGEGSRLDLTYAVGGYLKEGLGSLASGVDRVLTGQLARLKEHVEKAGRK